MTRSILVALWLRDTNDDAQGASIQDRLDDLENALISTRDYLATHPGAHPPALPPVLFVAPEYLFARPTRDPGDPPGARGRRLSYTVAPDTTQSRHLDAAQADDVLARLKQLSARHPSFVIVPGTIAWYRTLRDLAARDPDILSKLRRRIEAARGGRDLDLPVAGDRKRPVSGIVTPGTWREKEDLLTRYGAAAKKAPSARSDDDDDLLDNTHLCLNTAVVLHGGSSAFIYSKQGDFHEVLRQYDGTRAFEIAIPGRKSGTFEVEGMRFGLEICLDHAMGMLKKRMGWFERAPMFHIITSATIGVNTSMKVVAPHGFVVNAAPSLARYKAGDRPTPDDFEWEAAGLWYHNPAEPKLVHKRPSDVWMVGYPLLFYSAAMV